MQQIFLRVKKSVCIEKPLWFWRITLPRLPLPLGFYPNTLLTHLLDTDLYYVYKQRSTSTNARASPPFVDVFVVSGRAFCIVEHRAQPTEKTRVLDYRARALPLEVFVVKPAVAIQHVQIIGQFLWRLEVVDVYEWILRCHQFVIAPARSHDDRQHVVTAHRAHIIINT